MNCGSRFAVSLALAVGLCGAHASAQVTKQDYADAATLNERYRNLADDVAEAPSWIEGEEAMVYSKTLPGGHQFVVVDATTQARRVAFDDERLAAGLNAAAHTEFKSLELPFTRVDIVERRQFVQFMAAQQRWRCDLADYHCVQPPASESRRMRDSETEPSAENSLEKTRSSPDKKWDALIQNYNVVVRSPDKKQRFILSTDGSENNFYALNSIAWSPDSTRLVAYRIRPGYKRMVH